MRTKLVKIGNSRGLRLAKPLLEQAGLSDEVDIQVAPGVLTIRPVVKPRAGQGCLKVDSGAVFRDLNTAQREHPFDVVRQRAQTTAN